MKRIVSQPPVGSAVICLGNGFVDQRLEFSLPTLSFDARIDNDTSLRAALAR